MGSGSAAARGPSVWCVAKPHAEEGVLQAVVDFCCGAGGVDCREVYEGGECYVAGKVHAHASYAMNAYYQMHGRNYWNCDFKGTGLVTFSDPSKSNFSCFVHMERSRDGRPFNRCFRLYILMVCTLHRLVLSCRSSQVTEDAGILSSRSKGIDGKSTHRATIYQVRTRLEILNVPPHLNLFIVWVLSIYCLGK